MVEFFQGLIQADFLPHGWCYRWQPAVVWLHVVSDFTIALAYYTIPASLIYIVRRRTDLVYPWMFWLFGLFILACGTTHLFGVVVVWQPWYRLDGVIKAITAAASIGTAIAMVRVAPIVVSLPGPEDLRRINRQLAQEVSERTSAESEVRRLNADLERRVLERTRELESANERLTESENRLRAILDSSPTLVYLKDTEDRFLFINRECERQFGISRQDVIGKRTDEILPEEIAAAHRTADREVISSHTPREFEEISLHAGEPRTYISIKFPLDDAAGRTYAVCGIAADITERKKAEEELRQYNAELEQFAYVVSHDLQEPLRTVKSYTQLLQRRYRGKLDSEADEFVDFITSGVDRMRALISDLQSYSEIGRARVGEESADSRAVLESTLRHMSATIEESGGTVVFDSLPRVRVSPGQLGQLFQNLVSNAIKYAKPTEPPRIEVRAQRRGREYEFVVADNGIGIERQYLEQIFGVFRRLHGHDVPGTGIGLAICKKVVESRGGRIWVVSEPGRGSEFHFTLPAA